MNRVLKDIVAKYVEKVGAEKAAINAVTGIDALLLKEEGMDNNKFIKAVKFKFAVIEYLYFHDDTEQEAICFGKTLLK